MSRGAFGIMPMPESVEKLYAVTVSVWMTKWVNMIIALLANGSSRIRALWPTVNANPAGNREEVGQKMAIFCRINTCRFRRRYNERGILS